MVTVGLPACCPGCGGELALERVATQHVEELLGLIACWCGIFELELLEVGENRFGAIDFNP